MEPSFIISKQKDQTKTKSESKKFIDCPNGTVPILKNTKEFVTNAQYWANKHFNSFTIDSHGTHVRKSTWITWVMNMYILKYVMM